MCTSGRRKARGPLNAKPPAGARTNPRNLLELEDGGEDSEINPYQENSFFFVGVICPRRAVKGELQHPIELCQAGEAKSIC